MALTPESRRYELIALCEYQQMAAEDISAQLQVPIDVLREIRNDPKYNTVRDRIWKQRQLTRAVLRLELESWMPSVYEELYRIACDRGHKDQLKALKELKETYEPNAAQSADLAARRVQAEAAKTTASSLSGLTEQLLQLVSEVRPERIETPILEGQDALPVAFSLQRQRESLDES